MILVSILSRGKIFLSSPNCRDGLQAHQTSYSMATRSYFLGGKWPGHAVAHSQSSNAELKNSLRHVQETFYVFLLSLYAAYFLY